MEPTNWALNAAQINHDIQLANEHLPAELQVPMYRQFGTTSPLEDLKRGAGHFVSRLTWLLLAKTTLSKKCSARTGFTNRAPSL